MSEVEGRVWSTFRATKSCGTLVTLRIQELPKSRIKEAVDFLMKYMVEDELFHKATGIARNPKAIEQYRLLVSEDMTDPAYDCVVCCEDKEGGEVGQIVAVSAAWLVTVGAQRSPLKDINKLEKELQTLIRLSDVISNLTKRVQEQGFSHFYKDLGIAVHAEFRKMGIATELLKVRLMTCVARNVPATGVLVTSVATLKAVKKDKWEPVMEINLDDLERELGVTFEKSGVCILMMWKNPQFKQ